MTWQEVLERWFYFIFRALFVFHFSFFLVFSKFIESRIYPKMKTKYEKRTKDEMIKKHRPRCLHVELPRHVG